MSSDSSLPHPAEATAAERLSEIAERAMYVPAAAILVTPALRSVQAMSPSGGAALLPAEDFEWLAEQLRAALLSSRGAATGPTDAERKDVAFKLSRLAHWMLNDRGYTKAMAGRALGEIARELSPEMAALALGDAAPLSASPAPTATPDAWAVVADDKVRLATTDKAGAEIIAAGMHFRIAPLFLAVPTPEASVAGTGAVAKLLDQYHHASISYTVSQWRKDADEEEKRLECRRIRFQIDAEIERLAEGSPPTAPVASPEETRRILNATEEELRAQIGDKAFDDAAARGREIVGRALVAESQRDTQRLDWLERKGRVDIGWARDEESDERELYEVVGPVNDREWELRGSGKTIRAAIDAALSAPSQPGQTP